MTLPELEELLGLRGAAQTLRLRAQGPSRALLLGGHRGAHRGRGLEFEEVRPYVAGDDARAIDWRVTARRGRLHTKLFREERERPIWLVVDLQPGLFFGSRRQFKSALAVRAAALLAWIAAAGGDRCGAVIANGSEILCLAPRAREAGVLPILSALVALQPRVPAAPRPETMSAALGALAPLLHPGSQILALSDFAGDSATGEAQWSRLTAHAEAHLFWIGDELERRGLPDGRYRGGLPGRLTTLDGGALRARWLLAWQARAERVRRLADGLRLSLTALDTGEAVEQRLQAALIERSVAA